MAPMTAMLTRRTFVRAAIAVGGLAAVGCGAAERKGGDARATKATGAKAPSAAAQHPAAMTVYRDPSCGCCKAWAAIAQKAGYRVELIDHPDMPSIKRQYGVPDELRSCHTGIVGGYAVEGHVPIADVKRLLARKPTAVRGIAVAGMPLGSPGMEVPDGTTQPFRVMAFDGAGKVSLFRG